MVEWLKDSRSDNRILIVYSEAERRRILDQYFPDEKDRDEYCNRILSFSDSLTRLRGRSRKVVGFDNLDIILQNIVSPNQLGPVTITGTEI